MATALNVPRCPRCRTPHDGHQGSGGALECAVCDHHWFPSQTGHVGDGTASGIGSFVTPVIPKSVARPPTDEYLPGDPQTEATRHGPLTERKDGRRSGRQIVIRPAQDWQPPVQDPITGSDLFEKLEHEARVQRSNLRTLPEIPPAGTQLSGTTASVVDPALVACPVCGVRFSRQPGSKRHSCPQCTTSFDEESGRLESGIGTGDRLIGATIHGCLIDRKLGEGGMGTVYHARQLSLDRSVAVKILPPDLARNKNFIQRFEREAKSLARINHPNILHIYDFGEDTQIGLYFMLIEYVEGLDLGEIINRRGQVSQVEMLDLLRQALTGLEAAAEKGVIHRDIKPDNLMIANNGTVKVSDFGLAKGMIAQVGVTAAGVRVGTPAFMSPEQCDGVDVDYRSDVYNLGATVYLCLTGRLPFDGETPFSIMLKHKTEIPSPMQHLDPTLDSEVDALILRMLAKQPDQRCQNLGELISIVERLEVKLSGTDSILRKSRGPFRAMQARVPINVVAEAEAQKLLPASAPAPAPAPAPGTEKVVPPAPVVELPVLATADRAPAEPGKPSDMAPTVGGGQYQDDGWKKLAADLMPLPALTPGPSGIVPTGNPSGNAAHGRTESSSRNRAVAGQGMPPQGLPTSAEITRNRVSSRLTPAIRVSGEIPRLNKKVEQELAQARERSRQVEADQLTLAGERLALDGSFAEAIRQWQAAVDILPAGSIRRAEVMDHIHVAGRNIARRRIQRRILGASVVTICVILGLFLATPGVHNWLADQRLALLRDGLNSVPTMRQRAVALREFAVSEGEPWKWYTTIFGLTYRIGASDLAQRLAEQETPKVLPPPEVPIIPVVVPIIPADSTWEEVIRLADLARQSGTFSDSLAQQVELAVSELAQQKADLNAIEKIRATGDHQVALDQAVNFRARHGRAMAATLAHLPTGLRVKVKWCSSPVPNTVKILVDGVPMKNAGLKPGAYGESSVTLLISRMGGREVTVVCQANGWIFDQTTIAPESTTEEVQLTLRLQPAWHVPGARSEWASVHVMGSTVVLLRSEGLLSIRATDGGEIARYAGGGRPLTPLLRGMPGGRIMVGTEDGIVQILSSTLVPEQMVHRGRNPVTALSEFELSYQNSRRVRLVVEDGPGERTLAAWDGVREWWTSTGLKPGLVPFLMHVDDRVMAIDGQHAIFLDEDGKNVKDVALSSARVGPVVPISGRREVVITTSAGHQRLWLGARTDPLRIVDDPVLAGLGSGLVTADADLLVHGVDGSIVLMRPDQISKILWRTGPGPRPAVAPVLTARYVITCDDQMLVSVRQRTDGKILWTLSTQVPVVAPPVIVDLGGRTGVVLLDRLGGLTAYPLP